MMQRAAENNTLPQLIEGSFCYNEINAVLAELRWNYADAMIEASAE